MDAIIDSESPFYNKPLLTLDEVKELVFHLYGVKPVEITEMDSYEDRNYRIKVEHQSLEDSSNLHRDFSTNTVFTFKVINGITSMTDHLVGEQYVMDLLTSNGINTTFPLPSLNGERIRTIVKPIQSGKLYSNKVSLLTYIPGVRLRDVQFSKTLLRQLGRKIYEMHVVLQNKTHKSLENNSFAWRYETFSEIEKYIDSITNAENRKIISEIFAEYKSTNIADCDHLKRGIIHGDLNGYNILVSRSNSPSDDEDSLEEYTLCGIIDFGDVSVSYLLYDLATCLAYISQESTSMDPVEAAGAVLAGYHEAAPLEPADWKFLKMMVEVRYAHSLTMSEYGRQADPHNEYLGEGRDVQWERLKLFRRMSKQELYRRWKALCITK